MFECAPSKVKALVFILNCINDNEEMVQSSDIVSTIGLITELNLSLNEPTTLDYKLTSKDIKGLCAVLRWFKQLKRLDVSNNDITDKAKQSFAKAMLQINTLNSVRLIGNPIFYDEPSMAVFDTIIHLREKQVQSIIYDEESSSRIECQSIVYVMECNKLDNLICFKSFDSIITVEIDSKFDYGNKILEYLDFLPFLRNLKIIHVTSVTVCAISQLNKYLSQNTTLTTLDLSSCNLENIEIEPNNSIPLKILKLNHCHITDKVLHNLSLNILKFTNLDQFEIEGNHFGDKGITNLHNVLVNTEGNQPIVTITELNLANNQLTEESAIKIIEIVQKCKVTQLNISENCLQSILTCFENCAVTILEELNISANNSLTDNAVEFAENLSHLKSCRSLKKINISNNCIDDKAIDKIYYSLIKCIHLNEVICDENPAENAIRLAVDIVQNLCNNQGCVESIDFKGKPTASLALMSHISLAYNDYARVLAVHVSQVTSIDFSCNGMEIDKNIICLLETCTQLEDLDLQNNNITNETFKYLATGFLFASKLMLSNLCLDGNPCMDDPNNLLVLTIIEKLRYSTKKYYKSSVAKFQPFLTVLELVDSVNKKQNDVIKAISSIKQLKMSYSEQLSDSYSERSKNTDQKLQSYHVKDLCKYLKYFKSLESIDMTDNNIEEEAKDDLAIALLKQSNIHVELKGNPILKIRGCFRLFHTIREMHTCGRSCMLKDRPETLEALVIILQYINDFDNKSSDITNHIEEIDISQVFQLQHNPSKGNEKISNINPEKVIVDFIHHLKLFSRLKILNLSNVYLFKPPAALQELSKFLQNNNTLLELDISYNNIQAEGALLALKSLDKTKPLRKLKLACNKIIGEKCKEIALIINSLNVKVDISGNPLSKESKKILGLK